MTNAFKISGLSFKKTPLNIREKLALDESEAKRLMAFLSENSTATANLELSACNRTEVYNSCESDLSREISLGQSLIKEQNKEKIQQHINSKTSNEEAINHLFAVSMGLDAQVVGDIQISNQVKKAYQWSADEDVAGPFLHRLMHTIFFANKRVVQETAFRDGAASVSYATKELIEDISADIKDPKILILGLGEIGQDVCRNFVGASDNVVIANRNREKAKALSVECNFPNISLSEALASLDKFDVIVSSIAKSNPIITKDLLNSFEILTHKYFVDLSVPRSIETSVEEVHGVLLYNIDNIHSKASQALNKRIEAIPEVEAIITETLTDFADWSKEMAVSPTIKKFKSALENIRQEEIRRFLKEGSASDAKVVDAVTKSMMQKIIKLPVLQLKAACKRGEADTLADVLSDLFDLEKTEEAASK